MSRHHELFDLIAYLLIDCSPMLVKQLSRDERKELLLLGEKSLCLIHFVDVTVDFFKLVVAGVFLAHLNFVETFFSFPLVILHLAPINIVTLFLLR